MAHSITARIDDRNFSWEMTRRYDLQNTAFIWGEDERPILDLTVKLIPDAPFGAEGFDISPRRLYLMKPVGMEGLPSWCRTRQVFDAEEDDTYTWMEIEREPAEDSEVLLSIYKPMALVRTGSGWQIQFEDDNPRQSFVFHIPRNLEVYGLGHVGRLVNYVEELPLTPHSGGRRTSAQAQAHSGRS
ncbi:hypothetical protein [Rhizobium leguminosarum]|uniref:hypothetical protein n=1 Tax=Rhizobium leguminosarum TaxID=384 RepID=UPI002E1012ED